MSILSQWYKFWNIINFYFCLYSGHIRSEIGFHLQWSFMCKVQIHIHIYKLLNPIGHSINQYIFIYKICQGYTRESTNLGITHMGHLLCTFWFWHTGTNLSLLTQTCLILSKQSRWFNQIAIVLLTPMRWICFFSVQKIALYFPQNYAHK